MAKRKKKPTVLLTVPNQSWIHRYVTATCIALSRDKRVKLAFSFPSERPYENNMNGCAEQVLDGGYDWWLTMDDDNPPPTNVLDLVELDKDIIGCPTPVYRTGKDGQPWYWNVLDEAEGAQEFTPHTPCEGLQRVDIVGSGCMLVARRVLEKVSPPFARKWRNGRVVAGPDMEFCRKARGADCEVWAHYGYPCRHFTEVDLTDVIRRHHKAECVT